MIDKQLTKEIWRAVEAGDCERVAELVGSNKDALHAMTPFGPLLHVAAQAGKLNVTKLLLELGADINAKGGIAGGSALHLAASDGHIDVVNHLLACDAEMDVSEPERNPLFGAIHFGHTAIANLLIESGIDTDVRYSGKTMKEMDALAFAKERGRTDIAQLLDNAPDSKR